MAIADKVENITYEHPSLTNSMETGCSIALQDGNSLFEIQPRTYINDLTLTMCIFVEKCMESGLPVRLYWKKSEEKGYIALGVEYGGKNAKYSRDL